MNKIDDLEYLLEFITGQDNARSSEAQGEAVPCNTGLRALTT